MTDEVEITESKAAYIVALGAIVRGVWLGVMDYDTAFSNIMLIIGVYYAMAWKAGMKRAGLESDEQTAEEKLALKNMIFSEYAFIGGLLAAVEAGNKAAGGLLKAFAARIALWGNRYDAVMARAMAMARNNPKLKWVRNSKDGCDSCVKMDGRVYRAKTWERYNLRPQSPVLQCMIKAGGAPVCQCTWDETSEPATRGRPPNP